MELPGAGRQTAVYNLGTQNDRTGELAERSNAAVLKTVDCNRSGGSNPSLSAIPRSEFLINSPNLSTAKPLVSGEFVLNSSRQKPFA